jgi:hypothetical protein
MEKKHGEGRNKKTVSGDTHGGGRKVQLLEKQENGLRVKTLRVKGCRVVYYGFSV